MRKDQIVPFRGLLAGEARFVQRFVGFAVSELGEPPAAGHRHSVSENGGEIVHVACFVSDVD